MRQQQFKGCAARRGHETSRICHETSLEANYSGGKRPFFMGILGGIGRAGLRIYGVEPLF